MADKDNPMRALAQAEAQFEIDPRLATAVEILMAILLGKAACTDEERRQILRRHGLNAYLPIKKLADWFGDIKTPQHLGIIRQDVWLCVAEPLILRANMQVEARNLSYCTACREVIISRDHFLAGNHKKTALGQRFRLSPVALQISEYQKWVYKNRLGNRVTLPQERGTLRFFVRSEGSPRTLFLRQKLWDYGPHILPIIHGETANDKGPVSISIQITSRLKRGEVKIFTPNLGHDESTIGWQRLPIVLTGHDQELVSLTLPAQNKLGIEYYELQFWIEYVGGENISKFVPVLAVIRWLWHNSELGSLIMAKLPATYSRPPRAEWPMELANRPHCRFRPSRPFTSEIGPNRVLEPLRVTDSRLAPYFRFWQEPLGA